MTRYRPHRGGLDESMALVREVASRDELQRHLAVGPFPVTIVAVEPYGFDPRIGWDTYLVRGRFEPDGALFVLGYTDGPL